MSVEQQLARTDEPAAAEQARADADEADAPPTEEQAAANHARSTTSSRSCWPVSSASWATGSSSRPTRSAMLVVRVKPDAWRRAAEVSKHELECDYLSFISGIDWQPAPARGRRGGR